MKLFRSLAVIIVTVSLLSLGAAARAQDAADGIFRGAQALFAAAQAKPEEERLEDYRAIRRLLDLIVEDHPASDLAVRILLQETIEGVDIATIDDALAAATTNGTAEQGGTREPALSAGPASTSEPSATLPNFFGTAAPPAMTPDAGQAAPGAAEERLSALPHAAPTLTEPQLPIEPATEDAEKQLQLGRQDIRDIQARLSVLGFDPNGIDGLAGRGTREAIRSWQLSAGLAQTGFMSGRQLDLLRNTSEQALQVWLRDPGNAALYDPPVIALGPGNMSGTWRYTTNCGANSRVGRQRITGVMSIRHAGGGQYTGTLTNSQGFRGRVAARLEGRSVTATTNFGLLIGRVSLNARVDDDQLVIRGRDSNRCSFFASKS
ncbi:MAG: hypothetical protein EP307_09635 [Rhodobacteraceae bacterium]|nr:MAG: hypothetical protein EP307_09635 [Paracoccaceae bacterium]